MESQNIVFEKIAALLKELQLDISKEDRNRPWGGFYVIEESQAAQFAKQFFPEEDFEALKISKKLSPKILMVAPGKRLSWQYHHRRAEIWRCIDGEVAVATSHSDEETDQHVLKVGDKIKLKQGQRHRLIGLDGWGVVAEIWQHTDAANPSDEDDIVRLQDDFGR
ncbi:MAG: phosphoheptose isomerase [Sphingobacteriales bacterium]|nr:phosphoheptose isomerase [Sphingobacteriales bacterium]